MAFPTDASVVVLIGSWWDESTRAGMDATITATPVPAAGSASAANATPNLTDIANYGWIKSRRWVTKPLASGLYALPLIANDDPDLSAFGGYQIDPQGETPFLVNVSVTSSPIAATQDIVDAVAQASSMSSASYAVAVGQSIQVVRMTEAAVLSAPAPQPPAAFLTEQQTNSRIATALASGSGGATKLSQLTDVNQAGAATGQVPTALQVNDAGTAQAKVTGHGYTWPDLREAASVRTAAEGTPTNLLGRVNRFDATTAGAVLVQPLPPAVPGAVFGIGLDAGPGVQYVADGTDKIGPGAGATSETVTVAGTRILHCTTTGRWRVRDGFTGQTALDARHGRRGEILAATRRSPYFSSIGPAAADVPTIAAPSTSSTLPTLVAAMAQDANASGPAAGAFAYRGGNLKARGTGYPDNFFVYANQVTNGAIPSNPSPLGIDFWFDGTDIELIYKGFSSQIILRVNGQIVDPAGISVATDGQPKYLKLTFPTRKPRLISIDSNTFLWGGVKIGATDSVWPAQIPGPRCIVVGDSFTEGTGANLGAASNWVRAMADLLGWPDTWSSGLGGTGYLNPGTGGKVKYRDRFTTDVSAYSPDVVMFTGGINDVGTYTAAQIGAEAALLFAQARAENPRALLIVSAPFWRGGPSTWTPVLVDTRDALRTAALNAGAIWVDPLNMPLSTAPGSGQVTTATSAGATTVATDKTFPVGAVVKIGSEYRQVITSGGGAGGNPQKFTVKALANAYPVGTAITEVGQSLWTGTGRVGNLQADGNSDVYVGTDGTHPTQVGHDAIGSAEARLLLAGLSKQAT